MRRRGGEEATLKPPRARPRDWPRRAIGEPCAIWLRLRRKKLDPRQPAPRDPTKSEKEPGGSRSR